MYTHSHSFMGCFLYTRHSWYWVYLQSLLTRNMQSNEKSKPETGKCDKAWDSGCLNVLIVRSVGTLGARRRKHWTKWRELKALRDRSKKIPPQNLTSELILKMGIRVCQAKKVSEDADRKLSLAVEIFWAKVFKAYFTPFSVYLLMTFHHKGSWKSVPFFRWHLLFIHYNKLLTPQHCK